MELAFNITSAQLGDGAFVVSVEGEADVHTAPELERELQNVLQRDGSAVALDLVEVPFIDSTVLGLLLRYQSRFRARGGDLIIVSEDRRVTRTFEITGLDRIFRIVPRLGDAVSDMYVAPAAPTPTAA